MEALEKLSALWSDYEHKTSGYISELIESESGLAILKDIILFLHSDFRNYIIDTPHGFSASAADISISLSPPYGCLYGEGMKLSTRDIEDANIFKIVSGIRKWKDEISNAEKK